MTWQLAQQPRELAARTPGTASLLGGLVRCAGCSLAMSSVTAKLPDGRTRRYYACARRCSGGLCSAPASIAGLLLEPLIEDAFFQALARRRPRLEAAGIRAAEQAVGRAEAALTRYRDNDRASATSAPTATPRGSPRARRGSSARCSRWAPRGPAVTRGCSRPRTSSSSAGRDMSVRERRVARAELIECVFVTRGRRHASSRTVICLRGEGPADLPPRGCQGAVPRPFAPERCPRPPLRPSPAALRRSWSELRLRDELERFLDDRAQWPPWEAFHAAGHARLHEQLVLQGGTRLWAQRARPRAPPRAGAQAPLDRAAHPRDAHPLPEGQDGMADPRSSKPTASGSCARRSCTRAASSAGPPSSAWVSTTTTAAAPPTGPRRGSKLSCGAWPPARGLSHLRAVPRGRPWRTPHRATPTRRARPLGRAARVAAAGALLRAGFGGVIGVG